MYDYYAMHTQLTEDSPSFAVKYHSDKSLPQLRIRPVRSYTPSEQAPRTYAATSPLPPQLAREGSSSTRSCFRSAAHSSDAQPH